MEKLPLTQFCLSDVPDPPPSTAASCPVSPNQQQCPQQAPMTPTTLSTLAFALCALSLVPRHMLKVLVSHQASSANRVSTSAAAETLKAVLEAARVREAKSQRSSSTMADTATNGCSTTLVSLMLCPKASRESLAKTTVGRTGMRTGTVKVGVQVKFVSNKGFIRLRDRHTSHINTTNHITNRI